jgi:GxxExxY protein
MVLLSPAQVRCGGDFARLIGMLAGFEAVTERIIGCAIEVHRHTGPGLPESVYEACLAREFKAAHLESERQIALPIVYKSEPLDCAFRIDFVVEQHVLVEVKSVEHTLEVHKAQVITYLRLSGLPVGLLINFNVPVLRSGIRRLLRSPADCSREPSSAPPRLPVNP